MSQSAQLDRASAKKAIQRSDPPELDLELGDDEGDQATAEAAAPVDRAAAKRAISEPESTDPELNKLLSDATHFRATKEQEIKLEQTRNAHAEAKLKVELGWFGQFIGGEKMAPAVVATLAVVFALFIVAGCFAAVAYKGPSEKEFWMGAAEKMLGFAGLALGYLFGRGSSK